MLLKVEEFRSVKTLTGLLKVIKPAMVSGELKVNFRVYGQECCMFHLVNDKEHLLTIRTDVTNHHVNSVEYTEREFNVAIDRFDILHERRTKQAFTNRGYVTFWRYIQDAYLGLI